MFFYFLFYFHLTELCVVFSISELQFRNTCDRYFLEFDYFMLSLFFLVFEKKKDYACIYFVVYFVSL